MAVLTERKRSTSAILARGGSANVIGLDVIKREAGKRWDKMRDMIYSRLETIFRQKLGPTDFFIQIDDTSYLVTIPGAEPDDAQVACLRIAYDLHVSLLGPCDLSHMRIARADSTEDDIIEVTPIVPPRLLALAERAGVPLQRNANLGADLMHSVGAVSSARPAAKGRPVEWAHHFEPIWDARAEAISSYRCVVEPVGSDPEIAQATTRGALMQALATLERSIAALTAHIARGERFLLTLRISYEALASPVARMELVSACRGLSQNLRPYLIFEIAESPVGASHARLVELVTTLRPFGRAVIAIVPAQSPSLPMYQGIGLYAIGLRLPPQPDAISRGDVARLATNAKRNGLHCFLADVASSGLIEIGRGMGVQWMSGPAVAPVVRAPGPMTRLYTEEILQRGISLSA